MSSVLTGCLVLYFVHVQSAVFLIKELKSCGLNICVRALVVVTSQNSTGCVAALFPCTGECLETLIVFTHYSKLHFYIKKIQFDKENSV